MSAPRTLQPMIGVSASADFGSDQWTFEMVGDYKVSAGRHAIILESDYEKLKQSHNDLLEALDHLVQICDCFNIAGLDVDEARAAIAKATGVEA